MKIDKRFAIVAAAAALALPLAACGGGGSSAGGDPGSGGKVVIGVKFDQPGLGLKEGDKNTGFDVEVAKYVAKPVLVRCSPQNGCPRYLKPIPRAYR